MKHPFETTPLHILPHDDLARGGDLYVSRQWLPGMVPLQELRQLYGYKMRGVERRQLKFSAGGRTDTVNIGTGTGGVVQEWWPGDGRPQLSNNAGEAGRSLFNQTLFCIGEDYYANPTLAGDKFDAFFPDQDHSPKMQMPPFNFRQHTLIHGGRIIELEVSGNRMRVGTIPIEWDPDGKWKGMDFNHGGSVLTAREYRNILMEYEVDFHWEMPGVHRVVSRCNLPEVDPRWNLKWGSLGMFMTFGFDEVFAYRSDDAGVLHPLLDQKMCEPLSTELTSWDDKGYWVQGNLSAPHGRDAETRQNVRFLVLDKPVKVSCIFMDGPEGTRLRIDPKPKVLPPTGQITAPAAFMAQTSDVQVRYGWRNRIQIGGGSGIFNVSDQSGSYPKDLFGEGGNAIVYVSRKDSPNPWSFKQDLAVALYTPFLDSLSGAPGTLSQRHLRWGSKRAAATPTNGQKDNPVMILADTSQWNAGLTKPESPLESTAYVCSGTLQEVLTQLTELGAAVVV